MSIVALRNASANDVRTERLRRGDGCSSVYEARWLLGPAFALAIVVIVAGLLA